MHSKTEGIKRNLRKACAKTAGDQFRTFEKRKKRMRNKRDDQLNKYCICYGIANCYVLL